MQGILLLLIIVTFWYILQNYNSIEPMRGIGEGSVTYYTRLITKHINRPIKRKINNFYNSVKKHHQYIKRKYL